MEVNLGMLRVEQHAPPNLGIAWLLLVDDRLLLFLLPNWCIFATSAFKQIVLEYLYAK